MTDDFIATPTFIQSTCMSVLVCIDQIPLFFYHKGPVFKELCMLVCISVICTVQCTHRRYIFVHLYLFLIFVRYVLCLVLSLSSKHMIWLEVFVLEQRNVYRLARGKINFFCCHCPLHGMRFNFVLGLSRFL